MSFQHPPRTNVGTRFSEPAKNTLVSWINERNNRGFYPSQFTFDAPIPVSLDGTVDIPFLYNDTGERSAIRVQRVDIGKVPGLSSMVIHSGAYSVQSILDAIFEQYGLYLDIDMVSVDLNKSDLNTLLGNGILDGFNILGKGSTDDIVPAIEVLDCYITIKSNHLIYTGELVVRIRRSLLTNGNSIDRLLLLRDHYEQDPDAIPYVETYQPRGLWSVEPSDQYDRRSAEAMLYALRDGDPLDYPSIALVLKAITNTPWVADRKPSVFNIMGATVLYNGLASGHPGVAPLTHSYLLILELNELCLNLQGRIHIAYRYAKPNHPIKSAASTYPLN